MLKPMVNKEPIATAIKRMLLLSLAITLSACFPPSEIPGGGSVDAEGEEIKSTHETLLGYGKVFNTVDLDRAHNICAFSATQPVVNSAVFPFGHFAAVDTLLFDDGVACGQCYRLECVDKADAWGSCSCTPGASVVVMVADFGHDVADGSHVFDINPNTASNIMACGDYNDGSKNNYTATRVPCEHLGDIALNNYESITPYYPVFTVSEVAGQGAIEQFFFRENGRSEYYECHRIDNGNIKNIWVCDPWTDDFTDYKTEGEPLGFITEAPYRLPIDIKLVDDAGNEIEALDVVTDFGAGSVFSIANFPIVRD